MDNKAYFEGTANDSKFFTLKTNMNDFERIIYHCPDCFCLPTLNINEDLITANSTCEKNHIYNNISIEELHQKLVDTSISAEAIKANKNVVCFKCQTSLLLKDSQTELEKILHGFGFCHGCQNIICYNCLKNHDENEKKKDPNNHKVVPLDKYTNYCPYHRNKFSAYCLDCKKNMCVKCTEHRKHKKYHFDDYLLFEEDVKKYKKEIIDLRTNCENLESKVNSILDKIRRDFHEEMNKQFNILAFNELLLDAYQINQFNYFYLINVLNNFTHLEKVEEKVNIQDNKQLLIDLINKCDFDSLENDQIQKINKTEGELLHVSQPTQAQMTKQIKLDYTKDTVNPTFNPEGYKSIKKNDIINEITNDSKSSSLNNLNKGSFKSTKKEKENNDKFDIISNNNEMNMSKKSNKNDNGQLNQSIKNETQKSIKSSHNNETKKSIKNIQNDTKTSIKSSVKKDNSMQKDNDFLDSFTNNNGEQINLTSIKINKSTRIDRVTCEFIGKNYARDNYNLNDLPNNVETVVEIKNTGNIALPNGCYLFDENNCSSLMILDNVINSIEPGKNVYKQLKFDIYIYNKGSYDVKLSVKDPNGNFISSNKFDYTLVVE